MCGGEGTVCMCMCVRVRLVPPTRNEDNRKKQDIEVIDKSIVLNQQGTPAFKNASKGEIKELHRRTGKAICSIK